MAVQVCVLTFAPRSGTGVQTITGVIDKNGDPFVGKFFMFHGSNVAADTLAYETTSFGNAMAVDFGIDTGTYAGAAASAETPQFGVKICGTGAGNGYSLLNYTANAFFAGDHHRSGYVSAIRSGEFDITYDFNDANGDNQIVVIFGGSDLDIDTFPVGSSLTNYIAPTTTYTTSTNPMGLLALNCQAVAAHAGSITKGAGAANASIGFSTRDGDEGNATAVSFNQSTVARQQISTACASDISVTTWNTNSVQTGGSAGGSTGYVPVVFSGANVKAAGGSFNQAATAIAQTITTGINADFILLFTVGAPASASIRTDSGQLCVGYVTPLGQNCYWTGETESGQPLTGARLLSTNKALAFGAPNAGSTSINNVATVTAIDDQGTFEITWSSVDGNSNEIMWFALGTEVLSQGTLEVQKVWNGTPSQTRLRIGTTERGFDIANTLTGAAGAPPLTTGVIPLDAGTYYVSELNQELWSVTLTGTKNSAPLVVPTDGSVVLADGDEILVVITNEDRPPPAHVSQWKLYRFDLKPEKEETS